MLAKNRSILQIVESQVQRWQVMQSEPRKQKASISIVTISREPGSGGSLVGKKLAEELGMDFFHQELINEMAESAQVSRLLAETLDEKSLNVLEDWISSHVYDRHLWPDAYLKHLMKLIGTIANHGNAVIVGRGANFIIPREKAFNIRIVAPLKIRIRQVAKAYSISEDESKRRVLHTESSRKAFVHKYFYSDIADPSHYDLIVNTGTVSLEAAVKIIKTALSQ